MTPELIQTIKNVILNEDIQTLKLYLKQGISITDPHVSKQKFNGQSLKISQGFFHMALTRGLQKSALAMAPYFTNEHFQYSSSFYQQHCLTSALHLAIRYGHSKLVQKWVSQGFCKQIFDSTGTPALFWAIYYNEPKMASQMLLADYPSHAKVSFFKEPGKSVQMDWLDVLKLHGQISDDVHSSRDIWQEMPIEQLYKNILDKRIPKSTLKSSSKPIQRI